MKTLPKIILGIVVLALLVGALWYAFSPPVTHIADELISAPTPQSPEEAAYLAASGESQHHLVFAMRYLFTMAIDAINMPGIQQVQSFVDLWTRNVVITRLINNYMDILSVPSAYNELHAVGAEAASACYSWANGANQLLYGVYEEDETRQRAAQTDQFAIECQTGMVQWNLALETAGYAFGVEE